VAEAKARVIEGDLATSNFDSTLKKYKSEAQRFRNSQLTTVGLFQKFSDFKARDISHRTLEKYVAIAKSFQRYLQDKPAQAVTHQEAENFITWLITEVAPITARDRLALLKACWEWGIKQNLVEFNPWLEAARRVKAPPKQMPKPFSKEEIGAIILGFRSDYYYHHYADYVEFLFGTGCRTGEAIGLRWRHLSDDCSTVWIGESLSRGVRKATKTNKARVVD